MGNMILTVSKRTSDNLLLKDWNTAILPTLKSLKAVRAAKWFTKFMAMVECIWDIGRCLYRTREAKILEYRTSDIWLSRERAFVIDKRKIAPPQGVRLVFGSRADLEVKTG